MPNPIAETHGYPINNNSDEAQRYITNKLCPFHNSVARCTKNDKVDPIGVCSIFSDDHPVITCPVRFRESWLIVPDAAEFFFPGNKRVLPLGEVKLKDKHGKSVGKIDFVIVLYDAYGRIVDFAPLEVQAVYVSGNIRGPYEYFYDHRDLNLDWPKNQDYPKPDWLSSSMKRLVPQIVAKGSVIHQWGKKQAIAVQKEFFDRIPKTVPIVPKEEADMAWFLYDLALDTGANRYKIAKIDTIYSKFTETLVNFTSYEAGPEEDFIKVLQDKLNKVQHGASVEEDGDIIVE